MNRSTKRTALTKTHIESLRAGLCLWAALTCPNEEAWLELMEDVIDSKLTDSYRENEPTVWTVIIGHMRANIAEA